LKIFGADRGAGAAGADIRKTAARGGGRDITNLKYFRVTRGKIAGVPVDIRGRAIQAIGIRSVDALEGCGESLGRVDRQGQGV